MKFPISGSLLEACVLGIIDDGETYGYDLTGKVQKAIEVSESTLYPVLRRLLKDGMLTSYDKAFDGRNRRYYKITNVGEGQLDEYKQVWNDYKFSVEKLLLGGNEDE